MPAIGATFQQPRICEETTLPGLFIHQTIPTSNQTVQHRHDKTSTARVPAATQHHDCVSNNMTGTTQARAMLTKHRYCSRPWHHCDLQTRGVHSSSASLLVGGQQENLAYRDAIHIRGARFYGYHGVLPAENQVGQPFVVDASLYCDLRAAGCTDDLNKTVSYAEVFSTVKSVMEGKPHQLLESLAHTIAQRVLLDHAQVQSVQISISKLHIPNLSAAVDSVGVQVYRTREDLTT